MKCRQIFFVAFFFLFFQIAVDSALGDAQKPDWAIGNSYTFNLNIEASAVFDGGSIDLTCWSDSIPYSVTGMDVKTLTHGSQATHEVYILEYSGGISASGTANITDPIQLNAPVELRNASIDGEVWIRTSDLATVKYYRHITGECWVKPLFVWQYAGPTEIWENEEYDPPTQDIYFPASVGDVWTNYLTIYAFGHTYADLEVFGIPFLIDEDFDDSQDFMFESSTLLQEWMNSCWSYKAYHADSLSDAAETYWYCPESLWFSKFLIQNLVIGDSGLNVEGVEMNLVNYSVTTATPGPTDTPTQAPTSTPTLTPTQPPTLTYTPTQESTATDTPTAILTDTPSATPTHTPTGNPTATPTEPPPPTSTPTLTPTEPTAPTSTPTLTPTEPPFPTSTPTRTPTEIPTESPEPTFSPTSTYTNTPPPTRTPTRTPTDYPTIQSTPSATPYIPTTPSITPTYIFTMVPTTTPEPFTGVRIRLNSTYFTPGDYFDLKVLLGNEGTTRDVDLYVLLEVYGQFWFYPNWTQELDSYPTYLRRGFSLLDILAFEWPDVPDAATGLHFISAVTQRNNFNIIGEYDMIEWGFGPY